MKDEFTYIVVRNSHTFSHDKTLKFVTGIKAKLCKILFEADGDVVSYDSICEHIYREKVDYYLLRTLDVHICTLNKFLEQFSYKVSRLRRGGFFISKLSLNNNP